MQPMHKTLVAAPDEYETIASAVAEQKRVEGSSISIQRDRLWARVTHRAQACSQM
jgi:hypothetical protein